MPFCGIIVLTLYAGTIHRLVTSHKRNWKKKWKLFSICLTITYNSIGKVWKIVRIFLIFNKISWTLRNLQAFRITTILTIDMDSNSKMFFPRIYLYAQHRHTCKYAMERIFVSTNKKLEKSYALLHLINRIISNRLYIIVHCCMIIPLFISEQQSIRSASNLLMITVSSKCFKTLRALVLSLSLWMYVSVLHATMRNQVEKWK